MCLVKIFGVEYHTYKAEVPCLLGLSTSSKVIDKLYRLIIHVVEAGWK
jgi:hypothetical protein